MAETEIPPEQLRRYCEWIEQPLTPGKQAELAAWLAQDPRHQEQWNRWIHFNAAAKELQIIHSDVLAEWDGLRDDLGLGRSSPTRKKRGRSGRRKRSVLKSPSLVALGSMLMFGLFLLLLYGIRVGLGS